MKNSIIALDDKVKDIISGTKEIDCAASIIAAFLKTDCVSPEEEGLAKSLVMLSESLKLIVNKMEELILVLSD